MIPLFNPRRCPRGIAAVASTLCQKEYGPGRQVALFEDKLSELYDVRYVSATTSGTMALFLALNVLDWTRKHVTVYYPAYGFIAGAEMAALRGQQIKLVDVDQSSLQMTRATLSQEAWTQNPMFIFIEHNGIPTLQGKYLLEMLSMRNIPVIMDLACSIGNPYKKPPASFYTWSFSTPKLVQTGQGGAIGTDDEGLFRIVKELQDHGGRLWRLKRTHERLGFNLRFNDILASYGLAQLRQMKWIREQNREIWMEYNRIFNKPILGENGWCYTFWSKNPKMLIVKLAMMGIEAAQLYPLVCSNPGLRPRIRDLGGYPNAAMAAEHVVYLPSWLGLKRNEIRFIAESVLEAEERL